MRLPLFISIKFQGLFHSPPGVLFTFPSRYLFAIDLAHYLALEGGPPRFKPDFTCPTLLKKHTQVYKLEFEYEAFTLSGPPSQVVLLSRIYACPSMRNGSMLLQHHIRNGLILTRIWFRLFPVRSSLLWESQLISLPLVHEIFQFSRYPPIIGNMDLPYWVPPFGNPGV